MSRLPGMALSLLEGLLASLVPLAGGDYIPGAQYTDPTLNSADGHYGLHPPSVQYFIKMNGEAPLGAGGVPLGDDMHLVTGTADPVLGGGFVLVGSALKSENSMAKRGVAVKIEGGCSAVYSQAGQPADLFDLGEQLEGTPNAHCGRLQWNVAIDTGPGRNDMIIAAAPGGNGQIVLAGMKDSAQYAGVYDAVTGTLISEATWSPSSSSQLSALEAAVGFPQGQAVFVGGLKDSSERNGVLQGDEGFKSAGQLVDGIANVKALDLSSNLRLHSPRWERDLGTGTVKSLRMDRGFVVALVAGESDEPTVFKLSTADGTHVPGWEGGVTLPGFGQGNELAVVDNTTSGTRYYLVTGHTRLGTNYMGRVRRLEAETGTHMSWGSADAFEAGDVIVGNPPGGQGEFTGLLPQRYIYTECFSSTALGNGSRVALVCGTGVEGAEECDEFDGELTSGEIAACKADVRVRWRSLAAEIDVETGALLWERVESFETPGEGTGSSGGEYIFAVNETLYVVTDELSGAGLLSYDLAATSSPSPSPTPSPSPGGEYTCGEVYEAYQQSACCGAPGRPFYLPGRRLSATPAISVADEGDLRKLVGRFEQRLRAANEAYGPERASELAELMGRTLAEHLETRDRPGV